jgi:uncharacterized protein (TIGR02246 family)
MRDSRTLSAALSLALLLGACAGTPELVPEQATHGGVRAAIDDAWRQHIDAAQRKDLAAVLAIYADDVVYVVPGAQEARGRAEIETLEAEALATNDVLDATHRIDALRVYGDLAYELGTVRGPIRPRGQEASVVTFHFMAMWRLQVDGRWRIAHFMGLPESVRE